jgi:hypothetical protein
MVMCIGKYYVHNRLETMCVQGSSPRSQGEQNLCMLPEWLGVQ